MTKPDTIVKFVPIGDMLAGKTFQSFDQLRHRANQILAPIRDNWLNAILIKNNVFVNNTLMTKREVVEIYEKNKISIVDEGDFYRVYKSKEILGEWDNRRQIRITKKGKLAIRVEYYIK